MLSFFFFFFILFLILRLGLVWFALLSWVFICLFDWLFDWLFGCLFDWLVVVVVLLLFLGLFGSGFVLVIDIYM